MIAEHHPHPDAKVLHNWILEQNYDLLLNISNKVSLKSHLHIQKRQDLLQNLLLYKLYSVLNWWHVYNIKLQHQLAHYFMTNHWLSHCQFCAIHCLKELKSGQHQQKFLSRTLGIVLKS